MSDPDAEEGAVELVALDLGPLPVTKINAVLGGNLAAADAHFSIRAQSHSLMRHPADFELCRRYVSQIVSTPDYIGQAPDQADGFELIGEVPRKARSFSWRSSCGQTEQDVTSLPAPIRLIGTSWNAACEKGSSSRLRN